MSIEDPSYDELASNCCAQAIAIGKIRDILAEFTATPHNTGSPKFPTLVEVNKYVFQNGGSGSNGLLCIAMTYDFIERQLRAGA